MYRPPSSLWSRGVYAAPFAGPDGELVLIVVTSEHRLHRMEIVPHGAGRVDACDQLYADLDEVDPVRPTPLLRVI